MHHHNGAGDKDQVIDLTIGGGPSSLYVNEMDVLPTWTYSRPFEIAPAGFLSPVQGQKSQAIATDFAGSLNSTLTVTFRTPASSGYRVWIWFHYTDDNNKIELQIKQGKLNFREITGGNVVEKTNGNFSLVPNQLYTATISWDGTQYTMTLDGGGPTLSFTPDNAPTGGTFGVGAKKDFEVDRVQVDALP